MTSPTARQAVIEALPCPFCGGAGTLVMKTWGRLGGPSYQVTCDQCRSGTQYGFTTDDDALTAWNTRHTLPAAPSDPEADRRAVIEYLTKGATNSGWPEDLSRTTAEADLQRFLTLPPSVRAALRRLLGGE